MPTGHAACYHKNGGLHMLTDPTGGLLLDEVSHPHKPHPLLIAIN